MYFIKCGKVNLLRKVDFKTTHYFNDNEDEEVKPSQYEIEEPNEGDYETGMVEAKLLEINELGAGDCFGDDSLIEQSPIKHSVITVIPTEIFVLDQLDFNNLGEEVVSNFNNEDYPSDIEIRKALIEMKKWQRFKQDLLYNIHSKSKKQTSRTAAKSIGKPKETNFTNYNSTDKNEDMIHKKQDNLTSNYFIFINQ